MESTDPAGGLPAARQRLLEIWADPQVRALARRRAGDPELADDAMQSAYMAVARLENLVQIDDLRAYFCRVLVREVNRERVRLGAVLVDDFMRLVEEQEGDGVSSGRAPPTGFEEAVCSVVAAGSWHRRLTGAHHDLPAAVPARSPAPDRYRAVVYAAAEQILRDGISGDSSEADSNEAFRASYPEYFDQPGTTPNTRHQRLLRARADTRNLLQSVIS
jgi:DNA-directed RNA polymerase specialized sigma24 family protein